MKKKSVWIIVSMMVCLFCLSGCKPSALSEDEIADTFPENYRYLYIDGEAYLLDVKSIEIEKRKTDEDIDTVYCTIVMEDDNYRTTADYVLYYSYYDKGGWILDGCDTSDYYTEALCGLSQEKTDMEMSRYYFNSYNFVKEEFDKDTQTSYTYYDATFTSDNYSYQGGVVLTSYFYGYSWETSLSYENDFDWNVSGIWAADPLDLSGTRFKKTAFEIEIYSVDQAAGTVELSAREYYGDSVDRVDDIVTDNVVVDYTGMDYLSTAGYRVSPDEEAKERMKYEAPSLSFKFSVGGSNCAVRIKPYEATVGIAGSGEVSGSLNKGYSIYSWIDEYDFTQFEKVVQGSQFTQNNNTSAVGFDNGFEENTASENLTDYGLYTDGHGINPDDYVVADSASRYLTENDISELTLRGINYAKNEIFARYGRDFKSVELQTFFAGRSWYRVQYPLSSESDKMISDQFNEYEKYNNKLLEEAENAQGKYDLS